MNQKKLDRLAADVRRARDDDDQDRFVRAAHSILQWGGVMASNVATLDGLGKAALSTFSEASRLLDPTRAATSRLAGVRHMNSGWTKVYALMLDGLPIYDGCVGATMSHFVRQFCVRAGLCQVPPRPCFRWGPARGNLHNRNPSTDSLKFPMLTAASPRRWAECNVEAAWVLGEVCHEGRFGDRLVRRRRLRALEAGLVHDRIRAP